MKIRQETKRNATASAILLGIVAAVALWFAPVWPTAEPASVFASKPDEFGAKLKAVLSSREGAGFLTVQRQTCRDGSSYVCFYRIGPDVELEVASRTADADVHTVTVSHALESHRDRPNQRVVWLFGELSEAVPQLSSDPDQWLTALNRMERERSGKKVAFDLGNATFTVERAWQHVALEWKGRT